MTDAPEAAGLCASVWPTEDDEFGVVPVVETGAGEDAKEGSRSISDPELALKSRGDGDGRVCV